MGTVHTNPGEEHNFAIVGPDGRRLYPDVVVTDGPQTIVAIAEVETEETVTEDERDRQWKSYLRAHPDLRLYVPAKSLEKARELVKGLYGIRLRTWTLKPDGSFSFTDVR